MPNVFKTYCLFTALTLLALGSIGQNNVGIGTTTPHPSAILHVSDTNRGVLIPQTDTASIENYLSSLTPPSTVANGLMIYETNEKTYMYYDATQGRWKKLIDLVGKTGDRGIRGPQGPIGPTGHSTDWRDSTNDVPVLLNRDSCGDFYFNNSSGALWYVSCDTNGNRQWVDTLTADNQIGTFKAPDEQIFVVNMSSNGNGNHPPASGGSLSTDVNFFDIDGLNYSIDVRIDEIAYVWVVAHGSVSHSFGKNNFSYAQYDIQASGPAISVGHGGKN